jgi:phenylpropionate dioxygenase-like ring-hydroxylating dioxygenase large terminal subunit
MSAELTPFQARTRPLTSYEEAFADELESIYGRGAHELPAVLAALNEAGVRPADGADWTADSFSAELHRLANQGWPDAPVHDGTDATTADLGSVELDTVDGRVALGLRERWYALCPSTRVRPGELVRLDRAGEQLLLWRDGRGTVHVQEDRCPHRSARLSMGVHMGDRVACNYHGVQVDADGVVVSVPGSPGCALEGRAALRTFPAEEHAGAIFAWFGEPGRPTHEVPALPVPDQLGDPEWDQFLCYVEWDASWLLSLDNLMDPMHGAFLHRDSHTMFGGKREAVFQIRQTERGFFFEKTDQRGVNFDWSEWVDVGLQWVGLDIPYPATAGPGGPFSIVALATPIDAHRHAAFFWRCRKVGGWQRDSWRFLYRARLEKRHWDVLEQDRVMLEAMPPDAQQREGLYQHDLAVVRLRRLLRTSATRQLEALAEPSAGAARSVSAVTG